MSDLLAARSQMAVSLAFHIVFAVIGIAMPLLMVVAERLPPDLTIARAAAPRAVTLELALGAVGLGAILLFPSLYYLLRVFKRSPSSAPPTTPPIPPR